MTDQSHSHTPLMLRPATLLDIPPLTALIARYRDRYFDDFDTWDTAFLVELIRSGALTVIDDGGYPAGLLWLNHRVADLHVTAHLLMHPRMVRRIYREGILDAMLARIFATGVRKIKALPMACQTGTVRLLKRLRFKLSGILREETRYRGKPTDVLIFELSRKYWQKRCRKSSLSTGK